MVKWIRQAQDLVQVVHKLVTAIHRINNHPLDFFCFLLLSFLLMPVEDVLW